MWHTITMYTTAARQRTLCVPLGEWLASNRVKDGENPRLVCVLIHAERNHGSDVMRRAALQRAQFSARVVTDGVHWPNCVSAKSQQHLLIHWSAAAQHIKIIIQAVHTHTPTSTWQRHCTESNGGRHTHPSRPRCCFNNNCSGVLGIPLPRNPCCVCLYWCT